MRQMRVFMLAVILLATLCMAAEKSSAPAVAPVEKLIEQLKSDDFELREKAQALLGEAGEAARAGLENALKDPHGEADFVTRAKAVLEILDADNHVRRFDTLKRINLQLAGTLREALDQLKADFKCEIATESDNDTFDKTHVDVNVKNATFFEALEAIRISAKAGYTSHGAENTFPLALTALPEKTPCLTALNGQYMFALQSIETNVERTLNFNAEKPSVQQRLSLNGVIVSTPGVRVSALGLHEVVLCDATPEAYDVSASISAASRTDGNIGLNIFSISVNIDHTIPLKAPLSLKFTQVVIVPQRIEEKNTPLAKTGETVVNIADGVKLTLKPAESKDGHNWQIPFSANCNYNQLQSNSEKRSRKVKKKVKDPNDENDEDEIDESIHSSRDPICAAGFFVLDANGQKQTANVNYREGDETHCSGQIHSAAEPVSIIVRTLPEKTERKIALELKDIPLP